MTGEQFLYYLTCPYKEIHIAPGYKYIMSIVIVIYIMSIVIVIYIMSIVIVIYIMSIVIVIYVYTPFTF